MPSALPSRELLCLVHSEEFVDAFLGGTLGGFIILEEVCVDITSSQRTAHLQRLICNARPPLNCCARPPSGAPDPCRPPLPLSGR